MKILASYRLRAAADEDMARRFVENTTGVKLLYLVSNYAANITFSLHNESDYEKVLKGFKHHFGAPYRMPANPVWAHNWRWDLDATKSIIVTDNLIVGGVHSQYGIMFVDKEHDEHFTRQFKNRVVPKISLKY